MGGSYGGYVTFPSIPVFVRYRICQVPGRGSFLTDAAGPEKYKLVVCLMPSLPQLVCHSISMSEDTAQKIFRELIEPIYYRDIEESLGNRRFWKRMYHLCEGLSRLFLGVATVLSFANAVFSDILVLSFSAGSMNVMAIVFQQFATFSMKGHKLNHDELSILLDKIHIDTIPNSFSFQEGERIRPPVLPDS